jgi:hypothetical protein
MKQLVDTDPNEPEQHKAGDIYLKTKGKAFPLGTSLLSTATKITRRVLRGSPEYRRRVEFKSFKKVAYQNTTYHQ